MLRGPGFLTLGWIRSRSGIFYPPGAGGEPVLVGGDFRIYELGAVSATQILADTGLSFSRTTSSRVQTSSSTVSGDIGADEACIGTSNGVNKGLIVQPPTTNLLLTNMPRDFRASAGWTEGLATPGSTNNSSPDGSSSASRFSGNNTYGPFKAQNTIVASPASFSVFCRSNGASPLQISWTSSLAASSEASVDWKRIRLDSPNTYDNFAVWDSRDWSGVGGRTAFNGDSYVDFAQVERGQVIHEPIPVGNVCRQYDRLGVPDASVALDGGRFTFKCGFFPKYPTTIKPFGANLSNTTELPYWFLFCEEASGNPYTYVRINATTKLVEVVVNGGPTFTSTLPVSWSEDDFIQIYVAMGGGSEQSVILMSVNEGAWVSLGISVSPQPAVVLTGEPFAIWSRPTPLGLGQQDTGTAPVRMAYCKFLPADTSPPS